MLYSLCAKAQTVAALSALEAALGIRVNSATLKWRELLVLGESLMEALCRFMLHLPALIGEARKPENLILLRKEFTKLLAPVLKDQAWKTPAACLAEPDVKAWQTFSTMLISAISTDILGLSSGEWFELVNSGKSAHWLKHADTATARFLLKLWPLKSTGTPLNLMPAATFYAAPDELHTAMLVDPDFSSYPHWQGSVMETGALARMQHHPVVATLLAQDCAPMLVRVIARLLELVEAATALSHDTLSANISSSMPFQGAGLSCLQTLRGLLLHCAEVDANSMITDYHIVAPTEWNFHPEGSMQGLSGMTVGSATEASQVAEWMIQSLDPCVSYKIEVIHA